MPVTVESLPSVATVQYNLVPYITQVMKLHDTTFGGLLVMAQCNLVSGYQSFRETY